MEKRNHKSRSDSQKSASGSGAGGTDVLSGLGDRLRQARDAIGKTQAQMDPYLGLGKGSWQRYESGGQSPGSKVIAALAHLGFNAHWLLTGTGAMRAVPEPSGVKDESVEYSAWRAPPGWLHADRVRSMIEVIERGSRTWTPEQKAHFIVELCLADPDRDKPVTEPDDSD